MSQWRANAASQDTTSERRLELADLVADRRLGERQFVGCLGKTTMPRRSFEATERVQGR
jgi:hypothetical protein